MKILINTPDLTKHGGGVTNHYKGLLPYWSESVKYNVVGKRNGIPAPLILIYDYIKFLFYCFLKKYDVILLNPSLRKTAIKRDSLFLKIAKTFKIKTVVFFHGWSPEMVLKFTKDSNSFKKYFGSADKFLVLSKSFKNDLINWGIKKPIHLTTTKVNDLLLEQFNIEKKVWNNNILFLGRIETEKGIFTTLKAYNLVKQQFPKVKLVVVGNGSKLSEAKKFVQNNGLSDVSFLGNIEGCQLISAFSNARIYILPSENEGMPTSVLEAMAFGIPIISRPVGGLVDFFENEKMGYLIESFEPKDYAKKVLELLQNTENCRAIGKYNYQYANDNFKASRVVLNIERILSK